MDKESIEKKLVESLEKKKKFENEPIKDNKFPIKLNEREIELIAEAAISKITEKIARKKDSGDIVELLFNVDIKKKEEQHGQPSPILNNYFKIEDLEPKTKVIEQKEFSYGIKFMGFLVLACCIGYFIYFGFITFNFEPLTYTTFLTLILISFTLINKFESVFLNSITSISAYGFSLVTLGLILVVKDIPSLIVGPILHGIMAGFQLYLIIHKKIAVSKRYLIWGLLFYLIFLSSFDSLSRLTDMTGTSRFLPEIWTTVHTFYALLISTFVIYYYKKQYGILLP